MVNKTMNKAINKNSLNEKLDLILKNQKKILANEKEILGEEIKIENLENIELKKEDINQETEEEALKELHKLEKELKRNAKNSINKITKRDLFKGFIGAFLGIVGHFAFMEAFHISHDLSLYRITFFYILAFLMIIIMLYYTGFRKIKKHIVLQFMPLRALILYLVSIFAIIFVNLVYGNIHFPFEFIETYKVVGASIILAVLGAGTADLIGGGNH